MYKAFESIINLICKYSLRLLSFLGSLFQSSQSGRFFFLAKNGPSFLAVKPRVSFSNLFCIPKCRYVCSSCLTRLVVHLHISRWFLGLKLTPATRIIVWEQWVLPSPLPVHHRVARPSCLQQSRQQPQQATQRLHGLFILQSVTTQRFLLR